jgi:hypothetical protein
MNYPEPCPYCKNHDAPCVYWCIYADGPSPASLAAANFAALFLREQGADIAADGVAALVQHFLRGEHKMKISIKRLESGHSHIRGTGPCNYAQPLVWPCSKEELRMHAHPEASNEFLNQCEQFAEFLVPEPAGSIVVNTNEAGECVSVTRQDSARQIISVIWERK